LLAVPVVDMVNLTPLDLVLAVVVLVDLEQGLLFQ
jgi:hypothetical protein